MRASTHPSLLFSAVAALVACPAPDDGSGGSEPPPPPMAPAPEPAAPNPAPEPAPREPERPSSEPAAVAPDPTSPEEPRDVLATERPTIVESAHPTADAALDEADLPRVGNPYALPRGGAVADAAQKVETVRQLIDGLAQSALVHASRMSGDQPDVTGSTDVDTGDEKQGYVERLRATHRQMRELMHAVARCPEADPERPVRNRSAPVNQLAAEIDRYDSARATATEANEHVEQLRPIIVRWKSVYIDPETAQRASEADWSPPRDLVANWCP